MIFDFTHLNNTRCLISNMKKSNLIAMSSDFNGQLYKQYIFFPINNLQSFHVSH